MSVATAFAQPFDKRTLFTFSGPVAMPGLTLPAGQYLFRLADPMTSGKAVQVLSADGTTPYGVFFSYPVERFEASSTPEIRFMETAKGAPAAVKTWWYPGERTGYEFVYPKDQARTLARGGSLPVLTTQSQTTTTGQTNTSDLARVSSTGAETIVSTDGTTTAATPSGTTQEGTIASSSLSIASPTMPAEVQASADTPSEKPVGTSAKVTRPARTRLPKTASNRPIIGIISVVAILGAASLYSWPNRRPKVR